ncbi:MAG: NADH ubiquinone oxidoreductase chain A, partial [uncultured Rubrobacteraceae bacterium]
ALKLRPSVGLHRARHHRGCRVRAAQRVLRRQAEEGRDPHDGPLRVRHALRRPAGLPLRDQLLPDRDALHPVRHRGRLPLPRRRPAQGVRDVRPHRAHRLHHAALRGVHLRLAQRCPGMEV